jgi:hypothetical protein
MEPGIIPSVMGGIGNQMFITAAAFATSKTFNCPLYILQNPISNNKHNKRKYNYNDSVFKPFGIHLNLDITNKQLLHQLGYSVRFCPDGFAPYDLSWFPPGSILASYYQYYPPLQPYEQNLRTLFNQGLESFRETITAKYGDLSTSAFLHVRRGDAHENLHIYYLLPIEYYQETVRELLDKNPNIKKIYIISDEFEWVYQQDFFKQKLFECFDNPDELETLALMTLCTGGAICGGSTFSWWGAYLGAHGKRHPVFVPKQWIKFPVYDLFPKEWTVVNIPNL